MAKRPEFISCNYVAQQDMPEVHRANDMHSDDIFRSNDAIAYFVHNNQITALKEMS